MRVIAIDGPAGSGKSTVGRRVAEELGLDYLDTGAMYRAVTVAALTRGVDPSDDRAVAALAERVTVNVDASGVTVDGHDVTDAIRTVEVDRAVSGVAANPDVRRVLVERQRGWARERDGGVIEGRDIGTVVFPDATLKLYFTARPEVRAARRAGERTGTDTATVAAELDRRDTADSRRATSPLTTATDATTIDTSDRDVGTIVAEVLELLR